MAIIVGQEDRKKSWFAIGGVVFFFIALVVATYYLFFSEAPLIEKIAVPPEVEQNEQIANLEVSNKAAQEVIDMPIRSVLKRYAPVLVQEPTGRENPFQSLF